MADRIICHANIKFPCHSRTSPRLEQGTHNEAKTRGAKTATEAQKCLGDPCQVGTGIGSTYQHINAPVCPHRTGLGFIHWFERDRLWHHSMRRTVRYLGVELEDALAISEAIEIYALGPFRTDGPKPSFVHRHHAARCFRIAAILTRRSISSA